LTVLVAENENLELSGPTAVTIGKFDGVHVGHRELIRATVAEAREIGGSSVVLTFWPHPLTILRPDVELRLLTSLEDRLDLIGGEAPDFIRVVPFDDQFARQTADDFLSGLRNSLGMSVLVTGREGRMGRERHAGVEEMQVIGMRIGFELKVVKPVVIGQRVSSIMVRDLLKLPDIERATEALGRLPSYAGQVARGDRRGRELGFPTANLEIDKDLSLPANGVYSGRALLSTEDSTELRSAVINLGVRPTFGDNKRLLEAHLLDFDGDIYGEWIRVYFEEFLRPERRFEGVEALKSQIATDTADARLAAARSVPPNLYVPWSDRG
jgi:riboflavin kinase/FMN adenylyltransferase